MLATTLLAGAMLLQAPPDPGASVPVEEPQSVFGSAPQWFVPDDGQAWGFRNFLPRFGVQHRSQGYGYDRGYTSLESFIPLIQNDFSSLTSFQGNWIIDNGGEMGCNTGIIQRNYIAGLDRIIGGNIFYDHRQQDHSGFNQVGVGVETFGNYLDWRMNGYFPVGQTVYPASGGGITSAAFSGRQILVNFLGNKALTGFDSEMGGIIPGTWDMLRGYAGFYHFTGKESDSLTGVQARLEARIQDSITLHMLVTNDNTFGTNFVLAAGFYLPGIQPRNVPPGGRVPARLSEQIYRNQNIIIERSQMKDPVPARWTDGSIIDVVHINSAAAGPGTGAVLDPFQTLTAGQAAAGPESILFAHANSVFNNENVVLQNGQQLLGEGINHTINSMYGSFVLPTVTPPQQVTDVPWIQNSPGPAAVTVTNDTVVSGFRILDANGAGVLGNNVTNVTLDGLFINNSGADGVHLTNAAGVLTVENSFVQNGSANGIVISTATTGDNIITIDDNSVTGNPGIGIHVTTNGDTDNTLYMERNRVSIALTPASTRFDLLGNSTIVANSTTLAPLVEIESTGNSRLSARIENNLIQDNFSDPNNVMNTPPYFDQLVINAWNNSQLDAGFITNTLQSDRSFNDPASGPFGIRASSNDLSTMRIRFDTNTSSLNYAVVENYISKFQLEDTLATNTGTFYYFPAQVFFDTIADGAIPLP